MNPVDDDKSWVYNQFLSVRALAEIVITLLLDALLIMAVWWARKLVIWAIGIDPNSITDSTFRWIVRISEYSTFIILAIYILTDVLRHVVKSYRDLRKLFSNKIEIEPLLKEQKPLLKEQK